MTLKFYHVLRNKRDEILFPESLAKQVDSRHLLRFIILF